MRSKAFHAFEQKLIYFEDDLELVDVLRTSILNGELTDAGSSSVLKNVDGMKHSHIGRRKNSDGSRELIINHLRTTLYSAYVKDLYEELTEYLRTILEQASENGIDAGRVIGEHSFKIDAKTVLEAGNWNNITKLVADSIFQSLESEKSTLKLIEKISNKLALGVNKAHIEDVLPYLEVRHFLVHTDGKVSASFKKSYPHIKLNARGKVILGFDFVKELKTKVTVLLSEFDKKVIDNRVIDVAYTQP
ncbi:MAG: hypothetical protein QG639_614 [Patescibacteria group bacterium]|nr:hypothetical protein [Patescibacteria group bacterium]